VEDDHRVRDLAVMLLTDLGYRVLDAVDGRSALEAMEHDQPIDLLFLDLVMSGGMSGSDVAREAQRRLPGIKVLFTTGYTESAVNHRGDLHAGVHLLPKPYTKQDLARRLRILLDTD
jgi:CheY-like chemotaxis protein